MTLGIQGTGPYGKIRQLRNNISNCKYELRLIEMGMRRRLGKKKLLEIIATNRAEIKRILSEEKARRDSLLPF